MRTLVKKCTAPKPFAVTVAKPSKLPPELAVAQWPQTDEQWKRAIAFIQANLKEIMAICNKQAGPNAYCEGMPGNEAVLFWYGHIADHLIKAKKMKWLEPAKDYIDV